MKRPKPMNILYVLAFILLGVCVALFLAAVVATALFQNKTVSVIISVAGVSLCMIAIVLAMFSKPKTQKMPPEYNPILVRKTIEPLQTTPVPEEKSTDLS